VKTNGRALSILTALAVLAAPLGCSQPLPTRLPDPPSEELRSRLGRIGVTWSASRDSLGGEMPARGAWDGAGRGAVAGIVLDLKITGALVASSGAAGEGAAYAAVGALALGIGMLPVAALIGSIYGAAAAPDPTLVDAAAETLRAAIEHREFSRRVAEALLDRARVFADDPLAAFPPGSSVEGFDTVLEVEPPLLLLQGAPGVDPTLQLIVQQSASLRRVSDHQVLYRTTFLHVDDHPAAFLVWARDDAAKLRASLESLDRALGERLLDELFLLHPLPSHREWKKVQP
jgi:hypothetical protein